MTFEENLKQLQQVTKQLEQSTLPLLCIKKAFNCQMPARRHCRKQKNNFP